MKILSVLALSFLLAPIALIPSSKAMAQSPDLISYTNHTNNGWYRRYPSGYRSYFNKNRTSKTSPSTTASSSTKSRTSNYRNLYRNYWKNRSYNRTYNHSANTRTTRNYTYNRTSYNSPAKINVRAVRQSENLDASNLRNDLFEIGVSNQNSSRNQTPETLELRALQFQISDISGVFTDYDDWGLRVMDQTFDFNKQGFLTLKFNGAKITESDSLNLSVEVEVTNPDALPRVTSGFTVKLVGADIYQKGSSQEVKYTTTGRTSSYFVPWNPSPGFSSGGSFGLSGFASKIYGRSLNAGETETVLSMNLEANYDDLAIESITVRDSLSGGQIDQWSHRLTVMNAKNQQILDTAYFVNGAAVFSFASDLVVYRQQNLPLEFRITIKDPLPNTTGSGNQFKLNASASDIEVRSLSNGNNLSNSSKTINSNTETFTVSSGSGTIQIGGQPQIFPTGSLNSVFRFTISNPSNDYISVGRITTLIQPGGMVYPGGISTNDFALKEVHNGQEYSTPFTASSVLSTNTVRFDTSSDFTISPRSSRTFSVQAKLEDDPASTGSFNIAAQILGDSSFQSGTLSSLQSSGANFIWSDNSAKPHSTSTSDWLSGYLFPGLPTNLKVNR